MTTTVQAVPVASLPAATVWRCGGRQCGAGECQHEEGELHRHASGAGPAYAPPIVHEALRSGGTPLSASVRQEMESRLGHSFADVRIHTGVVAAASARAVAADAYTVGSDIVFGAGRFDPSVTAGRRLLAHELAHVTMTPRGQRRDGAPLQVSRPGDAGERAAEQVADAFVGDSGGARPDSGGNASHATEATTLHRQVAGVETMSNDADLAAEREYGSDPAPLAQTCGRPSHCPAGFCDPYRSQTLAEYYRAKNRGWILAGIAAAVDGRVVPLWVDYIDGGSAPRDLTATFGADFTASRATQRATTFLVNEVQRRVTSSRPAVATTASLDLTALVPTAVAAINTAGGANEMNFNVPRDVAGNLAGGIGTNQTACRSGARPSPFNDERIASGTVELARTSPRTVEVRPHITFRVRDTIDLCPGDCGTPLEQVATVPLSQFEATGISGDVPFTVDFPSPATPPFQVSY